jgi:hypothetical protein
MLEVTIVFLKVVSSEGRKEGRKGRKERKKKVAISRKSKQA